MNDSKITSSSINKRKSNYKNLLFNVPDFETFKNYLESYFEKYWKEYDAGEIIENGDSK